ncbi:MAG TPA: hypothetical protein VGM62_11595 [Chthoniobacterales bacterium]|jgi:hypothetical protein
MSKFVDLTQRAFRPNLARIPIVFALIIASVVSLWFATARPAQAAVVQICHKRVETISVIFGGLDYRRHKDHGDTDGPCGMTTSNHFLDPSQISPGQTVPGDPVSPPSGQ